MNPIRMALSSALGEVPSSPAAIPGENSPPHHRPGSGSVAYDGVETPPGSVDRMLGGAATYISLAASYFTPVKLVAVVGDDFAPEDAGLLASRGIDLTGLERVPGGKTFFWSDGSSLVLFE